MEAACAGESDAACTVHCRACWTAIAACAGRRMALHPEPGPRSDLGTSGSGPEKNGPQPTMADPYDAEYQTAKADIGDQRTLNICVTSLGGSLVRNALVIRRYSWVCLCRTHNQRSVTLTGCSVRMPAQAGCGVCEFLPCIRQLSGHQSGALCPGYSPSR